ncbi:MAG: hypothetical protein K9I94_03740 [Bacteroidales bacterium]|nr:hypothetical protein [Bacteroidales bacterium]
MKYSVYNLNRTIVLRHLKMLLLFALISCTCDEPITNDEPITKPTEIGHKVFSILERINKTDRQEYVQKNFLTREKIQKIDSTAKSSEVKEAISVNDEMMDEFLNNYHTEIIKEYNEIKTVGGRFGIEWDEIKYLDFVYEPDTTEENVILIEGTLYFKYDNQPMEVTCLSFYDGEFYHLQEIKELSKAGAGIY